MAERFHCLKKRNGRIIWISLAAGTILLSFVIYCALSEKSTESLRLVFVVFRHGDRTPTETYKNDPYINYSWPDGWGSLTNKGKLQLYELGQTLNTRYKLLIDENFSINDVYVRSSDADRCHMSGASLLAGMFPPTEKQIWNKNLHWQPVPIHALPRNLDNLIAMKQKCPTYDNALKNAYQSEKIQQLNEQNKELYKMLAENTGQDMSNITAVEFLFNTLEIEDNNGLTLPAWTKGIYPDIMKSIAARSLAIFTETPFMRKMKGGVLIKDMINQIENKLKTGITRGRRIFLYSAHDISLVNFLRPLGFLEYIKPEYGAAFVLEIHSTTSNDLEIKMFYYNSSMSQEPYALSVPSCSAPCLFTDFVEVVKPMIPNNWEQECQHAN